MRERMDDYIKRMWSTYAITISDPDSTYKGFIKKGNCYEIYIPFIDEDNNFISLMRADCRRYVVLGAQETQCFLNKWLREHKDHAEGLKIALHKHY